MSFLSRTFNICSTFVVVGLYDGEPLFTNMKFIAIFIHSIFSAIHTMTVPIAQASRNIMYVLEKTDQLFKV